MSKSFVRSVGRVGRRRRRRDGRLFSEPPQLNSLHPLARSVTTQSPIAIACIGLWKEKLFLPSQDFSLENASGWKECVLKDPSPSKRKALGNNGRHESTSLCNLRGLTHSARGGNHISSFSVLRSFAFVDLRHLICLLHSPGYDYIEMPYCVLMRDVASASNNLHQSEADGRRPTTG